MADGLKERIRAELNEARRSKDRLRTTVLTTTLSEIRNREIELGRDASDDDVVAVVMKAIKQRREAAEQMRAAGRGELADKEEQEAKLLGAYTPEPLSEVEIRSMVRQSIDGGADSIGGVMASLMPRIRGRFDGKAANRIVREELG